MKLTAETRGLLIGVAGTITPSVLFKNSGTAGIGSIGMIPIALGVILAVAIITKSSIIYTALGITGVVVIGNIITSSKKQGPVTNLPPVPTS